MLSLELTTENVKTYLDATLTHQNFSMFQRLLLIDNKEQYQSIMKGLINKIINPSELIKLNNYTPSDITKFISSTIVYNDFEKFLGVDGYNMSSFYNIVTENNMSELITISSDNESNKIRPYQYYLNIILVSSYYSNPTLFEKLNTIKNSVNVDGKLYNDLFLSGTKIDEFNSLSTITENKLVKAIYSSIYYPLIDEDFIDAVVSYDKHLSILYTTPEMSKYILNYTNPIFYKYIMYTLSIKLNGQPITTQFLENEINDILSYNDVYCTNPILLMNRIKFIIELSERYTINTSIPVTKIDKLINVYSFLTNLRNQQEEWLHIFFTKIRDQLNGDFPSLYSNELNPKDI